MNSTQESKALVPHGTPRWRIELFQELRVLGSGRCITRFRTQKTGALLAFLAYRCGATHSREVLIGHLWPEDPPVSGRQKLSMALYALRKQLEPVGVPDQSILVADRWAVCLNSQWVATDVAVFERLLGEARKTPDPERREELLRSAVEAYRGELLPGHYEEWIPGERSRLQALYFETVRRLLLLLLEQRKVNLALDYAIRAVAMDPLREEMHRITIRLYALAGRPDAALRQWEELALLLRREYQRPPSRETQELVAAIRERRGEFAGTTHEQALHAAGVLIASPPPEHPQSQPALGERRNGDRRAGDRRAGERDAGEPDAGITSARQPQEPETEPAPLHRSVVMEPLGGAEPLDSPYYIRRSVDDQLDRALLQRAGTVLLKGASQVGKSSLLVRALGRASARGARTFCTDLEAFNQEQFASAAGFLEAVARVLADESGEDPSGGTEAPGGPERPGRVDVDALWDARQGGNANFRRFMRALLAVQPERPMIWALENTDRLFTVPWGSDVFSLLRSWHNERALPSRGPWGQLTVMVAYATEAHLFITDLNQSPFNVGVRFSLGDFTREQVEELNQLYDRPLRCGEEIARFCQLLGGHPFLVRCGLQSLASGAAGLSQLDLQAHGDEGVFGAHLRRLQAHLLRSPELTAVVRALLRGQSPPDPASFYRLRTAGVLVGDTRSEARLRCELYARYLQERLPEP